VLRDGYGSKTTVALVDLTKGTRWSVEVTGSLSSPTRHGETVVLRYSPFPQQLKQDSGLVALSLGNGKELWRHPRDAGLEDLVVMRPLADGPRRYDVYAGKVEDNPRYVLVATDTATGKPV
jgi:hypothetical protein